MRKILVIDGNGLAWKAAYTIGHLSYSKKRTGVFYGLLKQIISVAKKVHPDVVTFCWDSKYSKRKELFSEYKKKVFTPEEEIFRKNVIGQINRIKGKYIPFLGFRNNYTFKGFEADDIIANIVLQYENDEIHIVSSDNDLYQLLRSNVVMHTHKGVVTESSFYETFQISPEQWVEVKKLAGCSSDGVPGIPGVGEKTAIKYLKGELKQTSVVFKKINSDEAKMIIKRNERLVKLPFLRFKVSIEEDVLLLTDYITLMESLGMNSMLKGEVIKEVKDLFKFI